jgi:hypothetical protein
MLELVNLARMNPGAAAAQYGFDLAEIPDVPLEPLAMNEDLLEAARDHSGWMEENDIFSHTGSGGSSPGERASSAGWSGGGIGENISGYFSFGQSDIDQQVVVEERHGSLLRSPGHLRNIMNAAWSEAGIGEATGDWQEDGVFYDSAFLYTQDFSDQGLSYLTGVTFDDDDGDNFYDPGEGLGGVQIEIVDANGDVVETVSWQAGGYQIALEDGSYTVRFSGTGIDGVVEKEFAIAGGNVKVDLNTDVDVPVDEQPENQQPPVEEPAEEEPADEEPPEEDPTAEDPEDDAPMDEQLDLPELAATVVKGTRGDDVFMDQAGDQIIIAKKGYDLFVSEKSVDDFDLTYLTKKAVLLQSEDSAKLLFGFEALELDGQTVQLEAAGAPAVPVVRGTRDDDVFLDEAGDQFIRAGRGNDLFISENNVDDFDITFLTNKRVLLQDEESTKLLFGFETLEFADQTVPLGRAGAAMRARNDDRRRDDTDEAEDGLDPNADNDGSEGFGGCSFQDDLMVA